jgi:hypothetical protein
MNMALGSTKPETGGRILVEPGLPAGLLSYSNRSAFSSFGKADLSAINLKARGVRSAIPPLHLSLVKFEAGKNRPGCLEDMASIVEEDIYEVPEPMRLMSPKGLASGGAEAVVVYDTPTSSKVVGGAYDDYDDLF